MLIKKSLPSNEIEYNVGLHKTTNPNPDNEKVNTVGVKSFL